MASLSERLTDLLTSRPLEVDLGLGTERRLRAYLHRLNAEIATSEPGIEPFALDDGMLGTVLVTLAEAALDATEEEAGTRYDHCTGRPVAHLEEMPIQREA